MVYFQRQLCWDRGSNLEDVFFFFENRYPINLRSNRFALAGGNGHATSHLLLATRLPFIQTRPGVCSLLSLLAKASCQGKAITAVVFFIFMMQNPSVFPTDIISTNWVWWYWWRYICLCWMSLQLLFCCNGWYHVVTGSSSWFHVIKVGAMSLHVLSRCTRWCHVDKGGFLL